MLPPPPMQPIRVDRNRELKCVTLKLRSVATIHQADQACPSNVCSAEQRSGASKRLRCERELARSASPPHSTEPDALVVSSPPTKRSRLLCERFDAKQLERISRCLGMPVDRVEDFFTRNRRTLLAHMPPPGTSSGVLRAASLAWAIKRLCAAERRKACSRVDVSGV